MHKLKLESLQVESFEIIPARSNSRGTVQGHDAVSEGGESVCLCMGSDDWACDTQDYQACPDTQYLDCTFVCTDFDSCMGTCG
ncbi:MAG TPA: hypothetical protein VGB15_20860 [Longimicrobium sp.]|jgi:hypothetical protein